MGYRIKKIKKLIDRIGNVDIQVNKTLEDTMKTGFKFGDFPGSPNCNSSPDPFDKYLKDYISDWNAAGPWVSESVEDDTKANEIEHLKLENQRLQQELYAKQLDDQAEELLRRQNPALEEAWEKYLIVKKLIK